jgi:hypothetical protein
VVVGDDLALGTPNTLLLVLLEDVAVQVADGVGVASTTAKTRQEATTKPIGVLQNFMMIDYRREDAVYVHESVTKLGREIEKRSADLLTKDNKRNKLEHSRRY